MTAPHVPADASGALQTVTFSLKLSGVSTLPVSAGVELSVLSPDPSSGADLAAVAFQPASAELFWPPGEAGVRSFAVEVTGGAALAAGALVARVVNATNADVDAQRSVAAATARPAADQIAAFTVLPNKVRPVCPPCLSLGLSEHRRHVWGPSCHTAPLAKRECRER